MSNHTPGPWVIHQRSHINGELWLDIGYRLPDGTERGPICDVTGKRYIEPHACDHRSAAEIKYLVTPEEEQWANARLLAAAPEMLACLESIYVDLVDYAKRLEGAYSTGAIALSSCADQVHRVIQQAKGKTA